MRLRRRFCGPAQKTAARNDEAFFANHTVAVRVTFRLGWGVVRPERVVSLTTAAE